MDIPHFVYRLFNADNEIIYIGFTGSVAKRMSQHEGSKPWWSEVSRIEVEQFATKRLALIAEKEQIIAKTPRFNKDYAEVARRPPRVRSGKIGRPKLANARSVPRQIRFTQEQDDYIAQQAAEVGVNVSEWIRAILPVELY